MTDHEITYTTNATNANEESASATGSHQGDQQRQTRQQRQLSSPQHFKLMYLSPTTNVEDIASKLPTNSTCPQFTEYRNLRLHFPLVHYRKIRVIMYQLLTYLLSITLAIFSHSFWTMERDYPFGIHLGPEFLTAAFVSQDGSVVQAVKHEMTQAWKDFYLDTLQVKRTLKEMEQHAGTEQYKEFVRTLYVEIRDAVEAAMGRPVLIGHITYPQHLKGIPYLTPLYYTPYETYPEIINFLQIGPYLDSVRLAYGIYTAESLGYEAGTDLDWETPLVVHIDYQSHYLEVSIMIVAEYIDSRERMFRIDGFGGSEYACTQAEIEAFDNRFKGIIDEQIRDNRYGQTQPEDFRFIVMSGGAPASEFDKIRATISNSFPEFTTRFRSEVTPLWAGAEGAARQAKNHVIDPPGSFVDAPW